MTDMGDTGRSLLLFFCLAWGNSDKTPYVSWPKLPPHLWVEEVLEKESRYGLALRTLGQEHYFHRRIMEIFSGPLCHEFVLQVLVNPNVVETLFAHCPRSFYRRELLFSYLDWLFREDGEEALFRLLSLRTLPENNPTWTCDSEKWFFLVLDLAVEKVSSFPRLYDDVSSDANNTRQWRRGMAYHEGIQSLRLQRGNYWSGPRNGKGRTCLSAPTVTLFRTYVHAWLRIRSDSDDGIS